MDNQALPGALTPLLTSRVPGSSNMQPLPTAHARPNVVLCIAATLGGVFVLVPFASLVGVRLHDASCVPRRHGQSAPGPRRSPLHFGTGSAHPILNQSWSYLEPPLRAVVRAPRGRALLTVRNRSFFFCALVLLAFSPTSESCPQRQEEYKQAYSLSHPCSPQTI